MPTQTMVFILALLMILSSSVFAYAQRTGHRELALFFGIASFCLLVAIPFVWLSRDKSRRRR